LREGIVGAANAISGALRERERRAYEAGLKREAEKAREVELAADEAKKVKATRTFLGTWFPDRKDRWDSMGLADLEGSVRGLAAQSADRDRALRAETVMLNNAAVRDAAARRMAEQNAERGFLADLETFRGLAGEGDDDTGVLGPLAPELRSLLGQPGGIGLAALARNPDVGSGLRDRVLGEVLKPRDKAWKPAVVDAGDGIRALTTSPDSAQLIKPPESAAESLIEIEEEVGEGSEKRREKRKVTQTQYQQFLAQKERDRKQPIIDAMLKRRAELRAELAAGNRYVGPEAKWLPGFGDRQKELTQLEQELSDLGYSDNLPGISITPDKSQGSLPVEVGKTNVVNGITIRRTK
jgi:hypothetical protein